VNCHVGLAIDSGRTQVASVRSRAIVRARQRDTVARQNISA